MNSDFFYSKSTCLYVSRKPLKIDGRVKKASEKAGIKINWDDEARINFLDFESAKKILTSLGSLMLSPVEYWKVLEDAKNEKDEDMIKSLMSNEYCEWLDRVHLADKTWIDHPEISSHHNYSGEKHPSIEPVAMPGWFNPENNIDFELGIPKKIELYREKFATSWKYWSPDFSSVSIGIPRAPIRGYVTSVGKPSFDQGIPVDSSQPMQMVRECRFTPLEPPVSLQILDEALQIIDIKSPEENFEKILSFIKKHAYLFKDSKQLIIYKIREKLFDLLGELKINLLSKEDFEKINQLDRLTDIFYNSDKRLNYQDFVRFIKTSRTALSEALVKKQDIVFVMGHKNPDTDAIVSSLFEAWRNHLLSGETTYLPVVQNHKIPDEVRKLLGDEVSDSILLDKEQMYSEAKLSGLARWISVDQNREPEVQRYFISIIDHHVPSEISLLQDLPKTLCVIGSTTALIMQKMLAVGMYLDKELARILQGAALMDTENRVYHKMTEKDKNIMDYLKSLSEVSDEDGFYSELMSHLLNTDDPNILFGRDYKEDWGFGFAVAKIKKGFGGDGEEFKSELIRKAVNLAEQNNINKNLPLTVLKITDYKGDNHTVNRERVYLVFNKSSSAEFKSSVFTLLRSIINLEFKNAEINVSKEYIEFWGTGMQLSRKKTAPILEPLVRVFNEYFYSSSNKFWIKRDFLKKSSDVKKAGESLKINLSFDEEHRLNYLTFHEAKSLAENLQFTLLSLKEYWLALNDAKKIKDIQMVSSLQGSNFVEFLDTLIKDYKIIIEHPKISQRGKEYHFEGEEKFAKIPKGKPGLIHTDQIDPETGIPLEVRSPSEYGNPELWRYWEPDEPLVVPARSYIFLLKQPCWDGKFHLNDSFPNLGIRPCYKNPPQPLVNILEDKNSLKIEIKKEGDVLNYTWNN